MGLAESVYHWQQKDGREGNIRANGKQKNTSSRKNMWGKQTNHPNPKQCTT